MPDESLPTVAPCVDDRFQRLPIEGSANLLTVLDGLLKHPGRIFHEIQSGRAFRVTASLGIILLFCLTVYGIVVGSLVGGEQMWIAPAKIALGSTISAVICLPSLYIFLCLGGLDTHLRRVAGELTAAAALTALLLIGFAPVAWVFSQSTDSIGMMTVLHLIFWTVALTFGLRLLSKSTAATAGQKRGGSLAVWMVIYIVVSLQMMTALRPIIGHGDTFLPKEKQFFLAHWLRVMTSDAR